MDYAGAIFDRFWISFKSYEKIPVAFSKAVPDFMV